MRRPNVGSRLVLLRDTKGLHVKTQNGNLLPSQTGASHHPVRHDPPSGAQMERLLLVEHNPLFADGLALLFKWRTGLSSDRAGSLAEARAILEEAERMPACAVVDLDLPEGEGQRVLEELDGVPVVALIGGRNLRRQTEAMGLGAEEVLIKTEAPERIASAVERLMGPRSISGL
jgi:DNA-binding NarL/FixJ family response regulator